MSTTTTGKSKLHAIKTRQSNYNQTFSTENNNNLPHTSQPLGFPLPKDEHACSVSLPTWSSVVGYEEGDIAITSQLKCGYPRFVYHPYVIQLMHTVLDKYSTKIPSKSSSSQPTTQTTTVKTESSMDDVSTSCSTASDHYYYTEDCLVVPTKVAALRCQSFLQLALQEYKNHELIDNALISISHNNNKEATSSLSSSSRVRVIEWNILSDNNDTDTSNNDNTTIYAVLFPATTVAGMQAKAYWQHTGEVVSSRRAENYLYQLKIPITCRITGQQHCTIYNPAFITTCTTTKLREDICHTNDDKENQQPQQPDDTKKSSSSFTTSSSSSPHEQLRINIAQWAGINDPDFVFLNPSGMASIYASLRSS